MDGIDRSEEGRGIRCQLGRLRGELDVYHPLIHPRLLICGESSCGIALVVKGVGDLGRRQAPP